MTISVYTDARKCILGVCFDDLSGCSDWQLADIDLTPNSILTDDHGAALYRLEDDEVVERTPEERQADWPPEQPEEPFDENVFSEIVHELIDNDLVELHAQEQPDYLHEHEPEPDYFN